MGLSRSGGTAAYQKVVARVADLPFPLDAQAGDRIIVRETEEVYGLNATTRMWEVIGTLKKVGGRRPEELAAHLDSAANPHTTTLQQVLDAGGSATVSSEIVVRGGPKPVVRLLGSGSVLRIGEDAGVADGVIWVNAGAQSQTKTLLRFVDGGGSDRFVVSGDGSVDSSGTARFGAGFKGPALFDDKITASEGLFGADGYDLILGAVGAKNAVHLSLGDVRRATLNDRGLGIGTVPTCALDVSGDIRVSGAVLSSLNPLTKATLGVAAARWESAALKTADFAPDVDQTAITIRVPANAKGPSLVVTGNVPGDGVVITSSGDLGLGTDAPERRLDVRGSGIVVGLGKARVSLSTSLAFNRDADWKPQDPKFACWSIIPGGPQDAFSVSRTDQSGSTITLLRADKSGLAVVGNTCISGDLSVDGKLVLGGISGNGGQSVYFDQRSTAYVSGLHEFTGPMLVSSDAPTAFAVGTALSVEGGNLIGGGTLGSSDKPWSGAFVEKSIVVGGTTYEDGLIRGASKFQIKSPELYVGSDIYVDGALARIHALDTLEVTGAGGSVLIGVGQYPGISFDTKTPATMHGLAQLTFDTTLASSLPAVDVEQTWTGGGSFTATVVSVNENGSSSDSVLSDYRVNGKRVAAIFKDRLQVSGSLSVGGLGFKKLQEDVQLTGQRTETKFKIPAGVRVEAVVLQVLETVTGARFIQVGDNSDADRFASPSTDIAAGSVIRGLNHCDRGLSVQKTAGPVVITADLPAVGKVRVIVYYVDTASL